MFKDRLKQARKASGYTQESLAQAIGIKKSTLSGYESGNSEPDMDKIVKLMSVLKVDANFLYQDEINVIPEPAFSSAALSLASIYDSLDDHGKCMLDTVAKLESERMEEKPLPKGLVRMSDLPLYPIKYLGDALCDGTIETKYAAKQELRELRESSQVDPVPEHE